MYGRLREAWSRLNSSYWFFPALFTFIALALSAFTLSLDAESTLALREVFGLSGQVGPDGARAALNVMASSLIGVAATVFSITIAAVVYASGTYGPRILTNFMEDRGNQMSLATLIGTFVYALVVLCAVRDPAPAAGGNAAKEVVPQISLLVACVLMAMSVGVLVYLLNHIPSSIRIHAVLENIGRRLLREVDHRYPDRAEAFAQGGSNRGPVVESPDSGYIDFVDFTRLQELATKHETTLLLSVQPGDFVQPKRDLLTCGDWTPSREETRALQNCFMLSGSRTPAQDLTFLIDELAEIALRALSPGINDPYTAITCIHWLCASTSLLAQRPLQQPWTIDGACCDRVRLPQQTFADFIHRGLSVVRDASARNALAAEHFVREVVRTCEDLPGSVNAALLFRECDTLMEQARCELKGPALSELETTYMTWCARLRQAS